MLTLAAVVPEPSAACRAALTSLTHAAIPQTGRIAREMAEATHNAIPILPEDILEDTEASCRANISLVVAMLRDGVDPAGVQPPAEALHYSREFVHRGLPVEALLGVYRVGHGAFWQIWLELMRDAIEDREVLAEAIAYCSAWTFGYVDAVSGPLATSFVAEKERWARSAVAQRAEEVRLVLEGRPVDEQRTSQRLRYELARRHMAFVVWGDDNVDATDASSAFVQAAVTVAATFGPSAPLLVPSGRSVLWAWVPVTSDDVDTDALTADLAPMLQKAGARIGLGEPAAGVEGFRRSHDEALTARRIALLTERVSSTVRFDDVALTALLTTDLDAARRYVDRELGPLADDTDAMRRLVATVRVYLEENASFVRAARRLSVHENTVGYRVRRAADLLGYRLESRALRLHAALLLCEVLRRSEDD